MKRRSSVGRLGLASVVAVSAAVAFAGLGGTGFAGGLAKPTKAQYGGQYHNAAKVWVCHRKGNGGSVTIRPSINAWPAHEAHGDVRGVCAADAAVGATTKKAKKPKRVSSETTASPGKPKSSHGKSASKSSNAKAKGKSK